MAEQILDKLNSSQKEAVTTTEGYVRVIAGAGSGKTRTLTHRFAYLVNEVGIPAGNILCVTFTNKAANEMRQRIHMLTGDRDTGYINTFHGFCANVLKEESFVFNYPKSFLVLDNSDIDSMLSVIYEERNLSLRDMTFSKARDMIEMLKLFERPDYYLDMFDMSLETLKEKYDSAITPKDIIFYGYLYQEKKCFGLDYNDLIIFTLYTFKVSEESRKKWQKRLMYIMIDEFQDIDKPQYDLMEVLSDYHKNLFVVGDPDQTIYTWRGADIHYLLDFDKKFEGTKTIMMNDNYRSVKSIIDVANSLISKNKYREEKNLVSVRGEGDNTAAYFAKNADDEADFIAEKITELKEKNNENYKDMTILFRSHFLTRSLENALFTKQIPYVIYSGVQFYDRVEIKVALSYLRMLVSADDLAFKRVINTPKRNMGERRIKFLEEASENSHTTLFNALKANIDNPVFKGTKAVEFLDLIDKLSENLETKSISELLTKVLELSGYEEVLRTEGAQERLDNLAELKQSVYDYEVTCGEETNLDSYLKHIALYTNTDLEDTKDRVKLMTIHAAKGLEFKNVFICGLNEGIFPSKKIRTQVAMEEERRLAFVAITRAKDKLFLTEAMGRNFDGSPRFPSRFLFDIEKQYLEYINEPNDALIKETKEYVELSDKLLIKDKSDLFPEGSRVKHMILGEGTIVSTDQEMQAYVIKFDGSETERMISFKVSLELI
ncbi:DNA helicase-2 / ATP-dependent DNA helicase PcrA [Lachnospiraceae bacterium G41]|nr:DNA helicase-2 / ATP-dependent DNA helicase PcrA [Lachnospiraceae bacterium G41]